MILAWWIKPLAVLLLVGGLIGGYFWWQHRVGAEAVAAERVRVEALADQQREANRSRARDADQKVVTRTQVVDHYFVTTVKEFTDASAPLAACPVPEPLRRLLNDGAHCAREGGTAECFAGG